MIVVQVRAFFISEHVPTEVCSASRTISSPINRNTVENTVYDFLGGGSLEGFLVDATRCFNRACGWVAVSLWLNSVVWPLVMVMHIACIVEEVDDIWLNNIGVSALRKSTLRVAVLATMLQVIRVANRRNRSSRNTSGVSRATHVGVLWGE